MEVILNNLGATIKQARLSANLTQDELAEQVGITGRYIMALENEHKQPSFEVLCKIIVVCQKRKAADDEKHHGGHCYEDIYLGWHRVLLSFL